MAEMVVAVTIMVIVTAIVAGLFAQVRKMIGITQWGSETRAQIRTVVSTMAQDLENIDPKAYFIMLNRDYGWDTTSAQATLPLVATATKAPLLYSGDSPTADRRIWADRLAFTVNGPLNTLQNFQIGNAPVIGTSARVYYGQSLWTHELADMCWANESIPGVTDPVADALNPFIKVPRNTGLHGPYQMTGWTGDFTQRPAVGWTLLRRAVLHVSDPAADWTAVNYLGLALEIEWRAAVDNEFWLLNSTAAMYTNDELSRQIDAWAGVTLPVKKDWAALLWAPRVDTTWPALDPTVMARSRVLLPHAARVRFQVRLSDGTVVPHLNETTDNPRVRGGIVSPVYNDAATGNILNPDYSYPPLPWDATKPTFSVLDPTNPITATDTVHPAAQPAFPIPVKQVAYIWTPNNTNVPRQGTVPNQNVLYPVAVRIRIEVYDPQKRTPDPIALDEWLPVRWR